MTPQAIGELIDARQRVDVDLSRHDVAVDTLASLRRLGTLEEAPALRELPPHPDIPEKGEWIRQVHRYHGRESAKAWHLYSGWRFGDDGRRDSLKDPIRLQAVCGRVVRMFEWNDGRNRMYAERSAVQPADACKRCQQRVERDQQEVEDLGRLYDVPSAEVDRLVALAREADSAHRYTDEELRRAAEGVARDMQAGRNPLDGFMEPNR